jgi:hypothetical protein
MTTPRRAPGRWTLSLGVLLVLAVAQVFLAASGTHLHPWNGPADGGICFACLGLSIFTLGVVLSAAYCLVRDESDPS